MQLSLQLNVIRTEKPTWSYPAKICDCIRLLFRQNSHQNPQHRLCCSLLCKTNDKNVKNQFAVLNAILEVKKIKLSILRINSTLGRQTNNREKNTVKNNLYWMACFVKNFRYTYSITVKRSWDKIIKKLRIWQLSFKNGIYSKMIKSWVLTIGHIKVILSHFSTVSIPFLSKPQANQKSLKEISAL